jgi:hypothetical protein
MKIKTGNVTESNAQLVDQGRREAMQKIAVGVGFLAGCSVLPETWTEPIIGRIVLPAHAQTSGVCTGSALTYSWLIHSALAAVNGSMLTLLSNGTATSTVSGAGTGTWTLDSNNDFDIMIPFDGGFDDYYGTLINCHPSALSGTVQSMRGGSGDQSTFSAVNS